MFVFYVSYFFFLAFDFEMATRAIDLVFCVIILTLQLVRGVYPESCTCGTLKIQSITEISEI